MGDLRDPALISEDLRRLIDDMAPTEATRRRAQGLRRDLVRAARALDAKRLARALHGTGTDPSQPSWTWGSCTNWEPGWGAECSPAKHLDEATSLLRRIAWAGSEEP